MNYAVVDIGANTIRLSVYALVEDRPKLLFNKKQTVGLASYNDNGILNRSGIEKLSSVLKKFKEILHYYPTDKEYIFATASLRNVSNSDEVIRYIKENLDIDIDLLSGKSEANLGFLGISNYVSGLNTGLTMDIGGGSTEVVYFKDKKVKEIYNMDEGCLSLHKKFSNLISPKDSEIKNMNKIIKEKISELKNVKFSNHMIGIGGTIRNTAKLIYELGLSENKKSFNTNNVKKLYSLLIEKDDIAYKALLKVAPDRVHTMTSGLVIFVNLIEAFKINEINVSNYGIREGYIIDKILKKGDD